MPTTTKLYKITAIIIILLLFLQYLYLFPVKLNSIRNLSLVGMGSGSSSEDHNNHHLKSLFLIKTLVNNNFKRSPYLSTSSASSEDSIISPKSMSISGDSHKHGANIIVQDSRFSSPSSNSAISFISSSSPTPKVTVTVVPQKKKSHSTNNSQFQYESSDNYNSSFPICPEKPSTLRGFAKVVLAEPPTLVELGQTHEDILLGGLYTPPNCTSKDRVAIVVPFRDREEHLRLFLVNLLPFLKRQQVSFRIFVIEQGGSSNDPFNRAMLFNVGFAEANKKGDFDCFIFHDVDLIPENDYNLYNCPVQPRHMSVAVDKMQYKLPYRTLFGGISALTKAHFMKVNGFSNSFWGWGAEDDDMANRIAYNGLYISRLPPSIARYKMLKHKQQKLNNQRYRVLQKGKTRFRTDGLSNLKYTVDQVVLEKTYTLIRVQLSKEMH